MLDNVATMEKQLALVNVISYYCLHDDANVGCGAYTLVERVAAIYAGVCGKVRDFLHA